MYHVYLNQAYLFLYFFNFLSKSKTSNFCHTFLWGLQSWNLTLTWAMGWSVVYIKYKLPEYMCSFIFPLFSVSPVSKDKNLHLENCFNIPLMAMAGVCELCSLSAIFWIEMNTHTRSSVYTLFMLSLAVCFAFILQGHVSLVLTGTVVQKHVWTVVLMSTKTWQIQPAVKCVLRLRLMITKGLHLQILVNVSRLISIKVHFICLCSRCYLNVKKECCPNHICMPSFSQM